MNLKKNPHLLMLLTQDLQSPSGLGRYFPFAKYLVREGVQVSILALHSDFANLQKTDFINEGVSVGYVGQMHVRKYENRTHYFSSIQLARTSIKATIALFREGLKKNADLVFIGKPHPMNGLAGISLAKQSGVPIIVDCDDYEAESNHVKYHLQKKILEIFEKKIPKAANLVTTNTYFMRDQLIQWNVEKEKIVYAPNGVDTERFSKVSTERVEKLKTELGLNGKRVVGYYGSLNLKNHPIDLLFRSFKILADKVPAIKLLIVGGGKDIDLLKALAIELELKDKVLFSGRVNPNEMNLYYCLADVSVDPVKDTLADRGRCPLKIFESWQMGIPVVTSDVGDRKILAGNTTATLLTKPGDEKDLADKLFDVLSDVNFSQVLTAAGMENVKNYDWASIANRFHQNIELILNKQAKKT